MARYARAGAAGAIGSGLQGIGELLMRSGQYNDEQERLEAERAYRASRDEATDQYRQDQMDYRTQRDEVADRRHREDVRRQTQGEMRDLRAGGFDVMDATPSRIRPPQSSPSIGRALMNAAEPKVDRNPARFTMGDYDPSRDVSVQRAGALDEMRTENDIRAATQRAGLSGPGAAGGGSTSPDYDEVGQRRRILEAAAAVADIQSRANDPSYFGNMEEDIQRALLPYGYSSVEELSRDMQSLGPQEETPPGDPPTLDMDHFDVSSSPERFTLGPGDPTAPRLQGPPGQAPERPGTGERFGNFLSDVNPLNREGAAAEETSEIPDWFREQHPSLVEQGAPANIEEAWRAWQGGA